MTKLVDRFRALGIYNPHGFASTFGTKNVDDYVISYHPPDRASPYKSTVWSPHRQIDPKGHWMDYGAKAFTGPRAKSRPEAIAWATKHLKLADWVPCPADPSALVPKAVRDRGLAWLKEQADPVRDQNPAGPRR